MITHTGVTGRAFTRALASLSDSTSLTVSVGGIEYHGERLRSPHLSHQLVTVSGSASAPLLGMTLANERYTVYAVGPLPESVSDFPAPPAGMAWHEAALPASLIRAVAGRLGAITPGLDDAVQQALVVQLPRSIGERYAPRVESVLVRAAVALPIITGFDEDGRPVFVEIPEPEPDALADLAGITEATFNPEDEPPAPADDDPEPEPEG